jgi:ABC-type bacteriocin/lantibiotic exporter with double-glycine peptidase domain
LLDRDVEEAGGSWEHLPNHFFHNFLEIILVLAINWFSFKSLNYEQISFFVCLLAVSLLTVILFTNKVISEEKKYQEKLNYETAAINKERENAILIESSGLTDVYKDNQEKITQDNQQHLLKLIWIKAANLSVPDELLAYLFPFGMLWLDREKFNGKLIFSFWRFFGNLRQIFHCRQDYVDYHKSTQRINDFLALEERNDNLAGIKLSPRTIIEKIEFANVTFAYQGQQPIIKKFNKTFSNNQINNLTGENGTGKSTIFYLLLGMIKPSEGKIIIHTKKKQYDLQELNRKHWREVNVAYASHQTLLEKGSTGEKQLANIAEIVVSKGPIASLWLFDEANNALDTNNSFLFEQQLAKLRKQSLVIKVSHQDNSVTTTNHD